jgi:hypothetical protein
VWVTWGSNLLPLLTEALTDVVQTFPRASTSTKSNAKKEKKKRKLDKLDVKPQTHTGMMVAGSARSDPFPVAKD